MAKSAALNRAIRVLAPLGGTAATAAVGIAAYTAYALNGPRRHTWRDDYTFTPWELQVPYERISFETEDGLTLRGWWMPAAGASRTVVGLTGHKGAKHELLGIGSGLWRAGNNVLLFDFRGCGESDLAPLSLAHHEMQDARAAIEYALQRASETRLGLFGFSMGAALAILAAAADKRIGAVLADSSFASIDDVVSARYTQLRLPAKPIVALSSAITHWQYGYPFDAVRPIDVIDRISPRPIFIVHGERDGITPVEHAIRLFEAAGEPKQLWTTTDTPHCGTYFVDRYTYVDRASSFFADALDP